MAGKPRVGMTAVIAASIAFVCFTASGAVSSERTATGEPVRFKVSNGPASETFTILLHDPAQIAAARAIISGDEKARVHVMGTVVASPEPYNRPWHFHLDPDSISFFEVAIEVCDAATSHVEAHLDEVGGAFLPGSRWCPWRSVVSSEIARETPDTLWVGPAQQYTTLADAIAASHAGDTINVEAGTYTNDWATIAHALTIVGVGGYAHFTSDQPIANDKASLVVAADVTIQNLEFSGAWVYDHNGAGIRWEAGNLTVLGCYFHDNQAGILAGTNPTGQAVIRQSAFINNGNGDGLTHGVSIGHVASLLIDDDYFRDQNGGSHLKSRAAETTVINSIFDDPVDGQTNYVIDLPNGGTDVVRNNFIQQSATPNNSNIIHFGGEGSSPPGSLLVSGNTISSYYDVAVGVLNQTGDLLATVSGNHLYHISTVEYGAPASVYDNDVLPSQPSAPAWGGWTEPAARRHQPSPHLTRQ